MSEIYGLQIEKNTLDRNLNKSSIEFLRYSFYVECSLFSMGYNFRNYSQQNAYDLFEIVNNENDKIKITIFFGNIYEDIEELLNNYFDSKKWDKEKERMGISDNIYFKFKNEIYAIFNNIKNKPISIDKETNDIYEIIVETKRTISLYDNKLNEEISKLRAYKTYNAVEEMRIRSDHIKQTFDIRGDAIRKINEITHSTPRATDIIKGINDLFNGENIMPTF